MEKEKQCQDCGKKISRYATFCKSCAQKGDRGNSWRGGRIIRYGYVLILCPEHPNCNYGGYVQEHRLVMEKKLGRYLLPKEKVHHKNEDKIDNRPENLELKKHSKHISDHMKGNKHSLGKKLPEEVKIKIRNTMKRLVKSRFRGKDGKFKRKRC